MAAHMIGIAVYVSTTNPARVRSYPFGDQMKCPRTIQDAETGDVFQLVARHYEVDTAAIDETQARVRAFRARQYGAAVRDVIETDTATAGVGEAA